MIAGTKISCESLWKVYGAGPAELVREFGGYDPLAFWSYAKAKNHIVALQNVSFDVRAGEVFVIMGLSGSGKSTLVRCLSRLVEPTSGKIVLDGEDLMRASPGDLIRFRRYKMGMVFQNFGLLPHLTVMENVAFPLKIQGLEQKLRVARAQEMIELVGLKGREGAHPRELSGGQQQRVGIARSLAVQPELWFLDEPFSALDPLIRRQMQDEFIRLQRKLQKTIVFITHDIVEAVRLADRIAILKDGRIVQIGTPAQLVINPVDAYVESFTRDVPRERVLKVSDVMEHVSSAERTSNPVDAGSTLRAVFDRLAGDEDALLVSDVAGQVIGRITRLGVMRALGKPGSRAFADPGAAGNRPNGSVDA
jgi:glycine betaine/proline transport system ATP-binding protein